MTITSGRRGLILAVILSACLHGLIVLTLCLCRGPSTATDPEWRKSASQPYKGYAEPPSSHFVFRRLQPPREIESPPLEVSLRSQPALSDTAPDSVPTVTFPHPLSKEAAQAAGQGTAQGPIARPACDFFGGKLSPAGSEMKSIVFVLDRSLSMGINGGLPRARAEVCACLNALPPTVGFQVVPYDDAQVAMPLAVEGRRDLLAADPSTVTAMVEQVAAIRAQGGTNHLAGLRCGLGLRPEIVIFVTDADDFGEAEARAALLLNVGHSRIQVVHLTKAPGGEDSLRRLAAATGGTYRKIWPNQHLERTERAASVQVGNLRSE